MERKPLSFSINITVTGASGDRGGSGNTVTPINSAIENAGGYLRQIIVKPPQPTANYDFRIANPRSHNSVKRTELSGELSEDRQTPMPAGSYTCYIENASHNGTYEVELLYAEVY